MRYLIHCEKLYDDEVWEHFTKFIKKYGKKCHLFLMAPQPTYLKGVLGYRGTKEELSAKLKKRYKAIAKVQQKYGFKVGMHMHLAIHPDLISSEEKDQSVKFVYKWINQFFVKYGIEVTDINFGWYRYDQYTANLCKVNGLRIINDQRGFITIHDYDLPLSGKLRLEKWLRGKLRRFKGQGPRR